MEGISWASLPAACGLELAENVRLNNFLPTALSDVHVHALQMGEPLDTVLIICSGMASSLSSAFTLICFHGIWKPAGCNDWLLLAPRLQPC